MENRKKHFKVAVIGDPDVGKSSLMKKFTKMSFNKDYGKTVGAQFSALDCEIEGYKIRLSLWDITGGDEFHFLRPSLLKNSKAAIIVYSLEDNKLGKESFNHIPGWYKIVREYSEDIPIYLFANKLDLVDEKILDKTKIKKIVDEKNLHGYYLTSAITGQSATNAFKAISKLLHDTVKINPS